jgi:hypothetical protein
MHFWRSAPRTLISLLCGLCLVLVIHACNPSGVSQSSTPASTSPTVPSPQSAASPLPTTEPIAPNPEAESTTEGLYNPPRGDVRFVVISDLNSAYGSTDYEPEVDQAIALLPVWQPDVVLCSGDMIAGQNLSLSSEQIRAMWAAFDQHVAAPLRQSSIPFGFTIGNHDASGAQSSGGSFLFQQERDLAREYWNDPTHDPGVRFVDRDEFPFYYTFESGDVFVMAWDGSTATIPPEKLDWVERTLASPQAQQAKLRILLGHLPLYAVAIGRDAPGEVLSNADELRAILERYNVHTYISGHHHAYYPAHKGDLQLLHTGVLGSGPRALIDSDLPSPKTMTVVDINFNAPDRTTYTTYDMQTLQPLAIDRLPRFLAGHNGMVLRRDVDMEDLSAAERSVCEQRLSREQCLA